MVYSSTQVRQLGSGLMLLHVQLTPNLKLACTSDLSLQEEVGQLQSNNTSLVEQCEIEVGRSGRPCHLLDSANCINRNLREKIQQARPQYDQEFADFQYEHNGSQSNLATDDSCNEAPSEPLCDFCKRLEAYQSASVSLHLHLELDLPSGVVGFLMRITRFVNETIGVPCTRIVEFVSSTSDSLERLTLSLFSLSRCSVPLNGVVLYVMPM